MQTITLSEIAGIVDAAWEIRDRSYSPRAQDYMITAEMALDHALAVAGHIHNDQLRSLLSRILDDEDATGACLAIASSDTEEIRSAARRGGCRTAA